MIEEVVTLHEKRKIVTNGMQGSQCYTVTHSYTQYKWLWFWYSYLSLWFMITRQDIETPHLCRMDAEEDLDDLVGVICAGYILERAHVLDLTQLATFAAHGPGSRDGN